MKTETREARSAIHAWSSWIIFLLLCGHLIFCHGCHGEEVDDELGVTPPTVRNEERLVSDASQKRLWPDASAKRR